MVSKRKAETEAGAGAEETKDNSKRRTRSNPAQLDSDTQIRDTSIPGGWNPYPISKVYRLIEPGPVLLVTTGSLTDGTHNVMTIGFHMVMQHESPPLIGICLGPWDASFTVLKKRRECVLAIPSAEMAGVVVDVGNCSSDDEGMNKWEKFGLEALPGGKVEAPLVGGKDMIANIECVVEDTKMVSKYSMWVLKVVAAWENPAKKETARMFHHRGDGTFVIDGEILNLQDRMVKWKEYQD
ncbi:putative flavin reductase [Favolaschia claudopus]|uniref:Flavin reductase n=1 Tax=Favolaschia claudopus TaxID=2862362 RepID=A0AAW0BDG2_9AGAR